jgi:hypothetical protein
MSDKTKELGVFSAALDRILSVPKTELLRREHEYRKTANANPRKRGPKRGKSVNAFDGPGPDED